MERIRLAEDLTFSRIIHGLWRLAEWNYSKEETLSLIEFCLENGITTFDHVGIMKCKGLTLKQSVRPLQYIKLLWISHEVRHPLYSIFKLRPNNICIKPIDKR